MRAVRHAGLALGLLADSAASLRPVSEPVASSQPSSPAFVDEGAEWATLPGANVTLSYYFCCNDLSELANMLRTLKAVKFCFSHVQIVWDVPHHRMQRPAWGTRSEDYEGLVVRSQFREEPTLPGRNHSAKMTDSAVYDLAVGVQRIAKTARQLIRFHCPQVKTLPIESLHPLRYSQPTPLMKEWSRSYGMRPGVNWEYDCSNRFRSVMRAFRAGFPVKQQSVEVCRYLESASDSRRLWAHVPDTLSHSAAVWRAKGQYLFHVDGGWRMVESGAPDPRGFVQTAIELLRSDKRVFYVSPSTLSQDPAVAAEDLAAPVFEGKWANGTVLSSLTDQTSNLQLSAFLVDVARFKSLSPFWAPTQDEYRWDAREMFQNALSRKGKAVLLDASAGVVALPIRKFTRQLR